MIYTKENIISEIENKSIPYLTENITDKSSKEAITKTLKEDISILLDEEINSIIETKDPNLLESCIKKFIDNNIELRDLPDVNIDENYDQLFQLSGRIYNLALQRAESNTIATDEKEYQNLKNMLNDLISKINQENLTDAKQLLSETLVDLDFAYGKTTAQSFRISHYTKN